MNLFTIGFSKKNAENFFKILKSNSVVRLIDIRLNNKSQLAGFTNVKHLPYFLNIHDIDYLYRPDLSPSKELLDGYKKKKVSWNEYEIEYNKILERRKILKEIDWNLFENSVLLCSEPKPEQCHRRLLAEYLVKNNSDFKIKHL
ncbi:MAG: hypothetical protein OMM_09075 [Candidatus Magnetoglobus multicellularis str. Araruama]|uniref:DUF488 domain-containing protein n=1 Tax=Candidatus Magnetoglobus multicellularis str. Araruama TaxID=890399 RepID=A0A1V1P5K7_9BACT|nr:MAG: hypothetical protein OMM_09075 [Candidatus Magnetoglobus multicellularis str. Araruama]